jgi:hypothetical protein
MRRLRDVQFVWENELIEITREIAQGQGQREGGDGGF